MMGSSTNSTHCKEGVLPSQPSCWDLCLSHQGKPRLVVFLGSGLSQISPVLVSFAKSSKETLQLPLPLCSLWVLGGKRQGDKVPLQPHNPSAVKDKLAMQDERGQD